MKKVIMVVVGSLLFVAGYKYTRRQAEYTATKNTADKSSLAQTPVAIPVKTLPAFAFHSDKSFLTSN